MNESELEQKIKKIVSDALSQLETANGAGIMRMGTADLMLRQDIKKLLASQCAAARCDELKQSILSKTDHISKQLQWKLEERIAELSVPAPKAAPHDHNAPDGAERK